MGTDLEKPSKQNLQPQSNSQPNQLQRFLETCSDTEIGDALLAKLNASANANSDFQAAIQALLQHVLKIVEMADAWAQSEAEQRYVTFVREAARQHREETGLTLESSALVVTRSKQ